MDDLGLRLILADEVRRSNTTDEAGGSRIAEQTVVMEMTDFTVSSPFVIGDGTRKFPIPGVGTIESILLITEEPDYEITVELDTESDMAGSDETTFLDAEAYSDLTDISTELTSVAAYENDDGNHVLDIGPVDFLDSARAWVNPTDSGLTVRRQRAEVTIERNVQ